MLFPIDLFTEICKHGCTIETKDRYPIDHLPKCLVTINNNIHSPELSQIMQFKISSIIPTSVHIYFFNKDLMKTETEIVSGYQTGIKDKKSDNYWMIYLFITKDPSNHEKNIKTLDLLTHYLYTNGDHELFYQNESSITRNYPTPDIITSHKENLKNKMIGDLLEKNILQYICVIDKFLQIRELKLLIINTFMKLDNWHNVGISINFCSD